MGSEGWRNSKPQESVPPNSVPPESISAEEIAKLRAKMAEKRAARGGVPRNELEEDFIDTDSGDEKIALGAGRISISDYKTITLNTKSGNTYILRRGKEEDVYTLFNVRAKKIIELDFAQIEELNLLVGKPFVYGKNKEGKNVQTAVVISGEGTLLKV